MNVSLKGETIVLNNDKYYYVMDALYVNDIKEEINSLNNDTIEEEIKAKVFPYTDAPFAKILAAGSFKVENIKKADYKEVNFRDRIYFSCDSGLVVIIQSEIFIEFIKSFDYNILVDSLTEIINKKYWEDLCSKFNQYAIGLILAPGIDSGYEFEGGGIYKIINTA